jgi:META domain-containing protein
MVDFGGTAWRVVAMDGQPLPVGVVPTLELESGRGTGGSGRAFAGCIWFGFDWILDGGRAQIRPQGVDTGTCPAVPAQVEQALLARLPASTAYSSSGDSLILAGAAGQIQLTRDVPPIGDPGRAVLELLRKGEWRVVSAPGIADGSGPSRISFLGDTTVVSSGECSFSGGYHLLPQGRVKFDEIGWDTTGCDAAQNVTRDVVKRLLEDATTARVREDGNSVVFTAPGGEIVLGR